MIFDKNYILDTLSLEIRQDWNKEEETIVGFISSFSEAEKAGNKKRIVESMDAFKRQINKFPRKFFRHSRMKIWKRCTETMFDEVLWKEPLLGIEQAMSWDTLDAFKGQTKEFLKWVREFDQDLEIGDLGQALRNYMVYGIFRELNGLSQKCTPAIFGYSMLYPYTDNYIDNPDRSGKEKIHYNSLIGDKLKGNRYEAVSPYEENTVRLLAAIEQDYKRPDEIFEGLLMMLEAQRNSEKQSDSRLLLTEEQVLNISIHKGGLSVLIDRYMINHPFTREDIYFYYGFGFLLQLCDDLQDISQDRKDGSRTVFSICGSEEEITGKVYKLLRFTGHLFEKCRCQKREFKQFLLNNCYLLILFSAAGSGEHMTESGREWLNEHLPVSMNFYEEFKKGFSADSLEKDNLKYMQIMDALLK